MKSNCCRVCTRTGHRIALSGLIYLVRTCIQSQSKHLLNTTERKSSYGIKKQQKCVDYFCIS